MHPVILGINDVDAAKSIDNNGPRIGQFPWAISGPPPGSQRLTIRAKFLNTMISPFNDIQFTAGAETEIVRIL